MPEILSLGETMVLFVPNENAPLRYVTGFGRKIGGAESNFGVGMVRLGFSAGWISRLGDDEFGTHIRMTLRGEGLDVSHVHSDPEAPTGIYFKERIRPGEERVVYYRKGSAASRMTPADLEPDYFAGARLLHLSGITPALSESAGETCLAAARMAKECGALLSFDVNYREALWRGKDLAATLMPLAAMADVVLLNREEAQQLLGTTETEAVLRRLAEAGTRLPVLKLGVQGAAALDGGRVVTVPACQVTALVDGVGAGDSFAAGFLAAHLRGMGAREALLWGNVLAARALATPGDYECLPRSWEEAAALVEATRVQRGAPGHG